MQLPFENLRILKKYLTLKDLNFDITIYSEQPDYYYLFKDILDHFPKKKILYIYSSTKDKIINHKNENLLSFYVSNGYLRDFIFNNLKSNVVIMSTPDLNSFSLKRSNFVNNYIYVQHSSSSLHTIYRSRAFANFDYICCSHDYHYQESKTMEILYNFNFKGIIKHGYKKIDIIKELQFKFKKKQQILIAPTWGKNSLFHSEIGLQLIDILIKNLNIDIILRPHPITQKKSKVYKDIIKKYENSEKLKIENNIDNFHSLVESEYLITDWSGIASEYIFGTNRKVIFVDTPQKINNSEFQNFKLDSFENIIRYKFGEIITKDNFIKIKNIIKNKENLQINDYYLADYIYNIERSDEKIVQLLNKILE